MQVKAILNRLDKHASFVYEKERLVENAGRLSIEISIRPRKNARPRCSKCGAQCPGYDRLARRRFEYVPLWAIGVYFVYAPRRVACACCGVKVEQMPWAMGKQQLTETYAWFLARWARRLSWTEVAVVFSTSWEKVFRSVQMSVSWGRAHQDLSQVESIGIDEVHWQHGQSYLTLVYQIDEHCRRLLWVGQARTAKTLLRFFRWLGRERSAAIRFICSDMWAPYLKVIAKKASAAVHVLDRFHIMAKMGKAIDEVRAGESRRLKANGYQPVLTRTRWLLLKRPENLTEAQEMSLAELLQYNLRTVRAYLLKEDFQSLWDYIAPYWAGQFLDRWCTRAMRSKIEPMKSVARSMRRHRSLILNWFRARGMISAGTVEGFNNKAKLTVRKSYGFRTYAAIEVALYHALGNLPEPQFTHKFC